ncbi:Asp23/Gls24 family envelope stress response protein [bacterium]|jgi:uncharacterized alkaline shock family protein YloU|nr:Asp23/Gls24 family envelope stress response protein [bacterium]
MQAKNKENISAPGEHTLGETKIHNDVIATIAGIAIAEIRGIECSAPGFVEGIAGMLGKKHCEKGIKVEFADNTLIVDVSVAIEYGFRIPDVALEIQKKIKERVEKLTGNSVKSVNVCIHGIKLPENLQKEE